MTTFREAVALKHESFAKHAAFGKDRLPFLFGPSTPQEALLLFAGKCDRKSLLSASLAAIVKGAPS
jgi:hypothetical protein